jgi:hypothetical protein
MGVGVVDLGQGSLRYDDLSPLVMCRVLVICQPLPGEHESIETAPVEVRTYRVRGLTVELEGRIYS